MRGKSLDEIFYSEFTNMMRSKRGFVNMSVGDIPIPSELCLPIPRRAEAVCLGIKEEFYNKLNFSTDNNANSVSILRSKIKRKLFTNKGEIRYDSNGNVLTEDVVVPIDCIAILSCVKIGVPHVYEPSEKFSYVDFVKINGKIMYIYIVPRKYVYELNMCALTVGLTRIKNFYTGIMVTLVDGTILYINVVPFKPTHEERIRALMLSAKILSTKPSCNFDKEIKYLLKYWEDNNIMFKRELTAFQTPIKGILNCGIVHFNSTLTEFRFRKEYSMENVDVNSDLYEE